MATHADEKTAVHAEEQIETPVKHEDAATDAVAKGQAVSGYENLTVMIVLGLLVQGHNHVIKPHLN